MSSSILSASTYSQWVDALALAPGSSFELTRILSETRLFSLGMRASYLSPLDLWMDSQPQASDYQTFRHTLPKHAPFEFVPLAEIVLMLAKAARVVFPHETLTDATNLVAESYIASMANHTMLNALMASCNHNMFEYLDLVSTSWHIWYNFGSRANTRPSPLRISLHFRDNFTAVGALWQPGLNRGLLRLFGNSGQVQFSPVDESSFLIDIVLNPTT